MRKPKPPDSPARASTGLKGISIPGFKMKDGKLVKDERQYDISTQLKRKRSSRVRVGKKYSGVNVNVPVLK